MDFGDNERAGPWRRPAHGRACFDMLPATIAGALTGRPGGPVLELGRLDGLYERVVLVYLDAFGWQLYERHASHPLLAQAREHGSVSRLTSQFPSTTAAHMTTIHTGLPVGSHGVYEWFMLLPALDRIVAPLLFSFAGDDDRDTLLAAGVTADDLFPAGGFHPRLRRDGVEVYAACPAELASTTPNRALLRDAEVIAFGDPASGLAALGEALASAERAYGFVYLPDVDSLMHRLGPAHPEAAQLIDHSLSAIEAAVAGYPAGTLVLLTADHGMDAIDPARTHYVNELWPELAGHLATGADGRPLAPAGSARDLFLHTAPGSRGHVRARLAALLEGVAEVHEVAELIAQGSFGPVVGDTLRERVGDLVVLPYPGEAVYWHDPPRFEQRFLGQHGGLAAAELEIPLVAFVT